MVKSYLTKRKKKVFAGVESDFLKGNSGVPKGRS